MEDGKAVKKVASREYKVARLFQKQEPRNETLFVVTLNPYALRICTSSFNIQRSVFDISLDLVFRLPAAAGIS